MAFVCLAVAVLFPDAAADIPAGSGRIQVAVDQTRFDVFTYKPEHFRDGPLILVFHGVLRNADEYRDHAAVLGDRFGALVAAPCFDDEQFPSARYQQGGLLRDGKAVSREEWTWSLVPRLADAIRRRAGRPDMPYYLVGHSAGGQFLVRLTGFVDAGARRVVAANPGSYLFPSRDSAFPYSFGGLPEELRDEEALRRYLAQPLTIYLGTADTEQDRYLDRSEPANRQGSSRYQRGRNAFRAAQQLAQKKGWPFHWRLVEAGGVSHDAQAMFTHPSCGKALFGQDRHTTAGAGPASHPLAVVNVERRQALLRTRPAPAAGAGAPGRLQVQVRWLPGSPVRRQPAEVPPAAQTAGSAPPILHALPVETVEVEPDQPADWARDSADVD